MGGGMVQLIGGAVGVGVAAGMPIRAIGRPLGHHLSMPAHCRGVPPGQRHDRNSH